MTEEEISVFSVDLAQCFLAEVTGGGDKELDRFVVVSSFGGGVKFGLAHLGIFFAMFYGVDIFPNGGSVVVMYRVGLA